MQALPSKPVANDRLEVAHGRDLERKQQQVLDGERHHHRATIHSQSLQPERALRTNPRCWQRRLGAIQAFVSPLSHQLARRRQAGFTPHGNTRGQGITWDLMAGAEPNGEHTVRQNERSVSRTGHTSEAQGSRVVSLHTINKE